jgi:hypothetical protein
VVFKYQIGDLVRFDISHSLGIILDIKKAESFDIHDKISDVLVYWSDGEIFWCLDFTLSPVSTNQN